MISQVLHPSPPPGVVAVNPITFVLGVDSDVQKVTVRIEGEIAMIDDAIQHGWYGSRTVLSDVGAAFGDAFGGAFGVEFTNGWAYTISKFGLFVNPSAVDIDVEIA